MSEILTICEVGLRDGLQNEAARLTAAEKSGLAAGLARAGLRAFELGSFVNPQAVPAMADSDAVFALTLPRQPEARWIALVLNERGYDRAVAAGARAIGLTVIASATWSERNSRRSPAAALALAGRLAAQARAEGLWVRAYVSAAWHCPFEGPTPPARALALADALWSAGVDELVLADSIGHAQPLEVGRLVEDVGRRTDMARLAVHLHDTQALGLANACAALAAGIRTLDASLGGLGGCPFAPGAAGNLATEDLVFLAHRLGYETGVDLAALWAGVRQAEALVGRRLGGRTRAWWDEAGQSLAAEAAN